MDAIIDFMTLFALGAVLVNLVLITLVLIYVFFGTELTDDDKREIIEQLEKELQE